MSLPELLSQFLPAPWRATTSSSAAPAVSSFAPSPSSIASAFPSAVDPVIAAAAAAAASMEVELNHTKLPHPPHPYYPLEVEIVGYLANDWTVLTLLATFAAGCAAIFGLTYVLVKRTRPNLPATELLTILWFVLSGAIHLFFEGFYVYNFRDLGGSQHLFGQLWKEYALSDSRYLTQDPFVLCMETITAVCWGPLSFAVAGFIAHEHPMRYPLQAIVSLGQLYGDVLYYATSMFDHYLMDLSYSRPEAYYFWVYFVLMNAFWIAIPLALIFSSVKHSSRAINAVQKMEKSLKKNGALKKGQ